MPHLLLIHCAIVSRSVPLSVSWCCTLLVISLPRSCFCNPSGVSDIPTQSSANMNPGTVSSPIENPCFAAATATNTSNRMGDSVHPCATPCKIPTCLDIARLASQHLSHVLSFVSSFFASFVRCQYPTAFPTTHSFRTVSRVFCTSRKRQYVVSPVSFSYLELSYLHVCLHMVSTRIRFGHLNLDRPSLISSSFSNIVPTVSFRILLNVLPMVLNSVIPRYFPGSAFSYFLNKFTSTSVGLCHDAQVSCMMCMTVWNLWRWSSTTVDMIGGPNL